MLQTFIESKLQEIVNSFKEANPEEEVPEITDRHRQIALAMIGRDAMNNAYSFPCQWFRSFRVAIEAKQELAKFNPIWTERSCRYFTNNTTIEL